MSDFDWMSPEGKELELWITGSDLEESRLSKQPKDRHQAALNAIELAARLLRAGELSGWALVMVSDFLQKISDEKNGKLAAMVAEASPGVGRPTVERSRRLAVWAFKQARERGAGDDGASQAAYDAWRGAGRYAKDSLRVTTREGKETTQAAAFIDETLVS